MEDKYRFQWKPKGDSFFPGDSLLGWEDAPVRSPETLDEAKEMFKILLGRYDDHYYWRLIEINVIVESYN